MIKGIKVPHFIKKKSNQKDFSWKREIGLTLIPRERINRVAWEQAVLYILFRITPSLAFEYAKFKAFWSKISLNSIVDMSEEHLILNVGKKINDMNCNKIFVIKSIYSAEPRLEPLPYTTHKRRSNGSERSIWKESWKTPFIRWKMAKSRQKRCGQPCRPLDLQWQQQWLDGQRPGERTLSANRFKEV